MPKRPALDDILTGSTKQIARKLLGCKLTRSALGLSGYIVETEAYLGLTDPAAHSYHGKRTPRVASMYREAGHAYVYFIYGMYHCLNIVAQKEGVPEGVLIRALEVPDADVKAAAGPGKLCRFFEIGKSLDGVRLTSQDSPLRLTVDQRYIQLREEYKIKTAARVGLSHAEAKTWPLRFYFKNHPSVSKPS